MLGHTVNVAYEAPQYHPYLVVNVTEISICVSEPSTQIRLLLFALLSATRKIEW